MSMTNFQNGITSFGIPQIGQGASVPSRLGMVLFVDATLGAAGGIGDIESPYSTIQAAIDRIEAAGDSAYGSTIFVFPGTYDETLEVAGDGISIIGCVNAGYERPDVVPTAGVALTVTGQGFHCSHMRFAGNTSDTVIQNGNGFTYRDCVFDGDAGQAATEGCLRLVGLSDDSYTASEGLIENCLFRGSTSGAGIIIQHAPLDSGVGCSDNIIRNNTFYGNGVDLLSAVNSTGGGAGIYLNTTIEGNKFLTGGAAFVYINFAAGAAGDLTANSGLICGNFFADDALIAAQVVIAGQANVFFSGNFDAAGVVNGSAFNN